ncbi:hypothetical protein [Methylocapsa acidiphila]|uniref:hypothetical protein n=1 Tax=Methylocapsa acidiphila TaxID=133552 RepID=UPI0004798D64|nr:hypothetical protein [Methylocapsa acidiphila]
MAIETNVLFLTQGVWSLLGIGSLRIEGRANPIVLHWGGEAPRQDQIGILFAAGEQDEIWTTTSVYASTPVRSAAIIFAPIDGALLSSVKGSEVGGGVADFGKATNSALLAAVAA